MNILSVTIGECASAAVYSGDRVLAAVSEERFERVKEHSGFPAKSVEYCLDEAGLRASDLDLIAVVSLRVKQFTSLIQRRSTFKIEDYLKEFYEFWRPNIYEGENVAYFDVFGNRVLDNVYSPAVKQMILDAHPEEGPEANQAIRRAIIKEHLDVTDDKIKFFDHHTGHSYYGRFGTPQTIEGRKLVLTMDSFGDGTNATAAIFDGDHREEIYRTADCTLGRMWQYVTLLSGMKPHEHEYKMMGLAPYAPDFLTEKAYNIFKKTLYVNGIDFAFHEKPTDYYEYFRIALEGIRFDGIAGGLQRYTEEILSEWITNVVRHTGVSDVIFSGGVAMNIKANQIISDLPEISSFEVPASPDDHTLAVGTCYYAATEAKKKSAYMPTVYLGPPVTAESTARVVEAVSERDVFIIKKQSTADDIAERLAEGKIIGRCAGRMELGARSLGNRSILADPRRTDMVARINHAIKMRDFWMPFAPVIMEEEAERLLQTDKSNPYSPFMMVGYPSNPDHHGDMLAGLHAFDKTCRPQILRREDNPEYWDILQAFKQRTGVGCLVNTSFNLHGEPIVLDAEDAARVFELSSLDGLLLDDTYIEKREPGATRTES